MRCPDYLCRPSFRVEYTYVSIEFLNKDRIERPIVKYRDLHIDTLRGLACLLLVSYHVVGPNADLGLQISSGFLREFNDLLRYVRMPLFTFLSGIVYAYRPYQSGPVAYTKGKIRRLLFPMLTIGTIFAVVRTMTSTSEEASINFSTIHIYPVAHFWFVEALFIIFIFMIVLESLKAFENIYSAIVVMILACGVHLIGTNIEIFALDGALYLFPFFLGGMILQRFNLVENQPTIIVSLLLVAGLFILGLIATESIHAEPRFTLAGLAVELLLCTALLLTKI